MVNIKKITYSILLLLMVIAVGFESSEQVAAEDVSICENVAANIGEEIFCKIEVQNSQFNQLNSAHFEVSIVDNIDFTVVDDSWACSSVLNNIVCDKTYVESFPLDAIEYVDVSFLGTKTGKYSISVNVTGVGTNIISVIYNDSLNIPFNTWWCGDGECNGLENPGSCLEDCMPEPPNSCGDGICDIEIGENEDTCPEDCIGDIPDSYCGDHYCDYSVEDQWNCPQDCGF